MLSSIKFTNDFLGVWKGSCPACVAQAYPHTHHTSPFVQLKEDKLSEREGEAAVSLWFVLSTSGPKTL